MNDYNAGATSTVELIFLQDSTSTTGAGKTGLVYNTASLTCYYKRSNGTASVAVSLVTISTLGTFASGGFKEIDATNMPGCYEFHPPDAAMASGAKEVTFFFTGATGLAPRPIKFRLVSVNPDDAVHGGMSALPNTACTTNASLLTSGTGTDQITVSSGIVKANDSLGNALATASAVANIAVTTAALNQTAASTVIATGTETGTVANTATADGVYDSVADVAGTTDFYYQFSLGSTGQTAVGVSWLGYVAGVVNTIKVYAYNWGGAVWDQVGMIVGIAGSTNSAQDWDLTSAHTGTGGNLGLVRIRFNATGLTSSSTKTDRILCGYAVVVTYPTNFATFSIDASGRTLLAPTGLDAVTTTEPDTSTNGAMSTWNFRLLLRWAVSAISNGTRTLSGGTGTLTVKKLGNTTSTSQAITDDGAGNETLGAPT